MIRYTLKCQNDHSFDSWFKSADGFDVLTAAGQVSCPVCDSTHVTKASWRPPVSTAPQGRLRSGGHPRPVTSPDPAPLPVTHDGPHDTPTPLSAPASDVERAIAAMRKHVESTSDYVGVGIHQTGPRHA